VPGDLFLLCARLVVLFVAGSVVLAAARNPLVNLLGEVFNLPAVFCRVLGHRAGLGARRLSRWADRLLLSLNSARAEPLGAGEALWLVVGPPVWLALATVMMVADGFVLYLRIAALFHLPAAEPVISAPALMTIAWAASTVVFGAMLAELAGIGPLRRPFGTLSGRRRSVALTVAWIGLGLAVGTSVVGVLWGQFVLMHRPHPSLELAFVAMIGLLIPSAIAVAGWSLFACKGVVVFVGAIVLAALLGALRIGLQLAFWVIDLTFNIVVGVLEFAAAAGRALYNWLVEFPAGQQLGLRPIQWEQRPIIGVAVSPFDDWAAPGEPRPTTEP
jgi:hypothetical protein